LIRELVIEAELALDVPPPAEDLALRHEGESVAATGLQYRGSAASSNCLDVFEECTQLLSSLHRRRGRSIAGRAVGKLSVAIPYPGPDGAVGLERQAVGRAAGDRLHARQVAELRLHLQGRRAVFSSNVVAELALVVDAPAPHRAVGAHRQAARGDSQDVAEHAVAAEALHL